MGRDYKKIPIVDTAHRCGLVLNPRTLTRGEVEASCPFCGDHGAGKYHLFLNTSTDQYHCVLCGARGNSVTLYGRVMGLSNREAFQELEEGGNVYPMPKQPDSQYTEAAPRKLSERSEVYSTMLDLLTLSDQHKENLIGRGLSEERIERNQYRSMQETEKGRRLLADLLRSCGCDLSGIPGFRTRYGEWTLAGPSGFLIPVRSKEGLIQGLKIRLDDEADPGRKYRWLSSRDMPNGTRSYSWIHVTGDTASRRAYLTEGPLKGDVASFLDNNALFVCIGGVNGHLYFVPRHSMEKVDIFEDFMEALSSLNRTKSRLMANSNYIIDDAKQRDKMTEEFYAAVKKEIVEYQERADYLNKSGSQSPAIMERWVMKINALEGKKRHYEQVLRRELDGLDKEFESLKLLSQELSLRASGIRFQRAA